MSGETSQDSNLQANSQAKEWQSLQSIPMSDEMKDLVQKGIYGLDKTPTEDYLESKAGQKAIAVEEKFNQDAEKINRYLNNLNEQVESGAISEEKAQKYREAYLAKQEAALDEAINKIDNYRQDYLDGQMVGKPEEEWVDDPERLYNREEAIAEHEKEVAVASEHEKEIASAEEKDKITALEAEQTSVEKAKHEIAKSQEAIERAEALLGEEQISPDEAKHKITEHQDMIERARTIQGKDSFNIDAIVAKINQKAENDRAKRLETLGNELDQLRLNLAELFVKKNRIIGPKHRAEYGDTKEKYDTVLNEYLQLKAQANYESLRNHNAKALQARFKTIKESIEEDLNNFANEDSESPKTPEEIEAERSRLLKIATKAVQLEWEEKNEQLKNQIKAESLEDYIQQDRKLVEDVNNQIDNGNLYRKIISKVLGNEYYKKALFAHGMIDLGVNNTPKKVSIEETAPMQDVVPPEPSTELPVNTPENPADISANEAVSIFKSLNGDRVVYNPNYYNNNDGAIITDVNPAELNYPDGWYYAKGALRNKHNTTSGIYEEISMIRPDGTPWPSTFTAGNTPSSILQSSSETPKPTSEPTSTRSETTPETIAQQSESTSDVKEKELDGHFREIIKNQLGPDFNDNDLDIITMEAAPVGSNEQDQINDRIQDWWDEELDDTRRNAVLQYEERNNSSKAYYGSALRNYLQSRGLLKLNGSNSTNTESVSANTA